MNSQEKGDLGQAKVIVDLLERGYNVAEPVREDFPYDLILDRGERLEKVQVKYTESNGEKIKATLRSNNNPNSNGEGARRYSYTSDMIDWMAVYDKTTDQVFYIDSKLIDDHKAVMTLRLSPPKNNQKKGINFAKDFLELS